MRDRGIAQAVLLIGIIAVATASVSWNSARLVQPPEPSGDRLVTRRLVSWTDSGRTIEATAYVPAGPGPFPTLLFAPGMTVAVESYATFLTDLASRGFLVAAMPHPRFADLDDTRLIDAQPVFARALAAMANGLVAGHSAGDSILGRIDTARIAAIGHSIGGAGAASSCALDGRIRAAVDFDGSLYGSLVHEGARCPFLLIERARWRVPFRDRPVFYEERAQGDLHQDSVFSHSPTMSWVTVDGLDHMSYTDGSLRFRTGRWLREFSGVQMPVARAQRVSADIAADFLFRHLEVGRASAMRRFAMPRDARLFKSKP